MLRFVGMILIIAGLLYLVWIALSRRELSAPPDRAANLNSRSLEPSGQGLRFLGLKQNWAALALIAVGAAILIFSA